MTSCLKKKLPPKQDWHEYRYKQLRRQYGYNLTATATINGIFLAELEVEDTPKNRNNLTQRMKHLSREEADSEIFRGEAKQEKNTFSMRLEALLDELENSDFGEIISPRDIAAIHRIRLDWAIHEAKLFGLYQENRNEPSKHSQQKTDTGSPETDSDDAIDKQIESVYAAAERAENDTET